MSEILAVIPARGGSKGIPRKNLRLVAGRPLLAYSIGHARTCPEVTRVVVSTEDAEIASVARKWGAEAVLRPPELATDNASSEAALLHVLDHLRKEEGYEPDIVVFLQATSPARRPDEISLALARFREENADSMFSACPMHGFVWRRDREGLRSFTYDHRARQRRQDAPEDLLENGSIYVFKPWVLRKHGNRLGGSIAVHVMAAADSFQVDEPGDLVLAEAVLSCRSHPNPAADLARVRLLVLDFDGVLTDNCVWVDQNGREAVICDRGDGMGLGLLRAAGLDVVVLSSQTNPVVEARCSKLGIPCVLAVVDKGEGIRALAGERKLGPEAVAFVGNDVNDVPAMLWCGVPVAVADAVPAAKNAAMLHTSRPGGAGAVREVADWLLRARET